MTNLGPSTRPTKFRAQRISSSEAADYPRYSAIAYVMLMRIIAHVATSKLPNVEDVTYLLLYLSVSRKPLHARKRFTETMRLVSL